MRTALVIFALTFGTLGTYGILTGEALRGGGQHTLTVRTTTPTEAPSYTVEGFFQGLADYARHEQGVPTTVKIAPADYELLVTLLSRKPAEGDRYSVVIEIEAVRDQQPGFFVISGTGKPQEDFAPPGGAQAR